jgi:hypothetical protein
MPSATPAISVLRGPHFREGDFAIGNWHEFGELPGPVALLGVSLVHAILEERPAVFSLEVLPVGEILADIQLVLLTHVVKWLIPRFVEAVLHEILAVVSLEALIVGQGVTGFHFVLLRRSLRCGAGGKR